MKLDSTAIIEQIDVVIASWKEARSRSKYDDLSDLKADELAMLATSCQHAIGRFAPTGSAFQKKAETLDSSYSSQCDHYLIPKLVGVLRSLRDAYEHDQLQSVQEVIHASLFADFLEMAVHLLDEGYKDPAAVLAGGVLEEHLRKLSDKAGVDLTDTHDKPRKASALNEDLCKKTVYNGLEQKSVTAWLDLRNKAAHGKYGEYDKNQVENLLSGIRDFLIRHPA